MVGTRRSARVSKNAAAAAQSAAAAAAPIEEKPKTSSTKKAPSTKAEPKKVTKAAKTVAKTKAVAPKQKAVSVPKPSPSLGKSSSSSRPASNEAAFKTRANKILKGVGDRAVVEINKEKPGRGNFVVTIEGVDEPIVSLLGMKRPFRELKALYMDEIIEKVLEALLEKQTPDRWKRYDERLPPPRFGVGRTKGMARHDTAPHTSRRPPSPAGAGSENDGVSAFRPNNAVSTTRHERTVSPDETTTPEERSTEL
eukprot:CAMPEP_0201268978 /NCGR_PEP_ID=MMETSP0853-20130426/30992_1 /ASSEMBLY_ACC=CAM_ASM_000640 /TAXON_ID=183588 /ORGANISM="Pseudo-nitzschia fraudulenta, Strain WWA7" /LENGTH=252 /DNA_ID=CAMNT_0047574835 /DNA_START=94 /DNA_END=856 /DNA_ORIENTATION=-